MPIVIAVKGSIALQFLDHGFTYNIVMFLTYNCSAANPCMVVTIIGLPNAVYL